MLECIREIEVIDKTSAKGNSYSVLRIVFSNGYVYETFLNNEQAFIISSLV